MNDSETLKVAPIAYAVYGIGDGKHYLHSVNMIEEDWKGEDHGLGDYWSGNEGLAFIDAPSAEQPAGPSVVGPELQEIIRRIHGHEIDGKLPKGQAEFDLIAYLNAWGARRHQAGKMEQEAYLMQFHMPLMDSSQALYRINKAEKERDELRAELDEWRHTNKIDELQRDHGALAEVLSASAHLLNMPAGAEQPVLVNDLLRWRITHTAMREKIGFLRLQILQVSG